MTWTVQSSFDLHGQEIETWKSDTGEWAYAYGTELGGNLLIETLVTGFESEDDALDAANQYCYESACENAADAGC